MPKLTFIVLTYNEENIVGPCLESLAGIPADILVVDDHSTDGTMALLEQHDLTVVQHKFENYSKQRNWAQSNIPFETEWVCHLDADERLSPELRDWFLNHFERESAAYDAFLFPRRAVFMGRWIKYGAHYPNNYHARLYKLEAGKCEDKAYDQHFITEGKEKLLHKMDLINVLTDSLTSFIQSHNKWATHEAKGIISRNDPGEIEAQLGGNPIQKRRWYKTNFYERMPLFLRALFYFLYRYFIRLGFLDGKEGLIFHFLQGFWFRFLVDAKVFEMRQHQPNKPQASASPSPAKPVADPVQG